MELKEIQDLIRFVAKSGVSEVELESKGFKIVIKTGNTQEHLPTVIHAQVPTPAPIQYATPANTPSAPAPSMPPSSAKASDDSAKYVTVKSPMIGTFYRSSGPGKPPFVNVGDPIEKGKTVCIIEAMKLFNEIESDFAGTIVKVLVDDATPVEYDQPLFLVEPK